MDKFCRTEFWDDNVTWYSESPDFTPCFHETALVWAPCAFLWLLSPIEIYRIRTKRIKATRIPWTVISTVKVMFAVLLAFLSASELMNALLNSSERNAVDYFTPFVKMVTFAYVAVLVSLNHKKAIQASGTLFLFWMLMSISALTTSRSLILAWLDPVSSSWSLSRLVYSIKIIGTPLILVQWLLCCFSEPLPISSSKYPSPEWNASFLSRLLFLWFDGLIKKGYKTPVDMDDIYDLSDEFKSEHIFNKFCQHWSYPERPTIVVPLVKTFWPRLLGAAALQLTAAILTFVTPSMLDYFLVWLASDQPYWHGYFYAAVMFIAPFVQSLISSQYSYMESLSGMQMKTAVISALHRKALRMAPTAKAEFTTGQIVNLMSVDSQTIVGYVTFVNMWWIAPIQICIAMYMLWQQLGIATIAGVLVMASLIPINGYITTRLSSTFKALMKEKDKRSKFMNEIINGIRVLKMYAWETSFSDQVKSIRKNEILQLKIQTKMLAFLFFTIGCAPTFVAVFSFLTFTLIDKNNVLDPSKAFVSIALFNIIRMPLAMIPFLLNAGANFMVAKKRLNAFFRCEELNLEDTGRDANGGIAIEIQDGVFSWGGEGAPNLNGINVQFEKKKLVAVVGTVGSGKSSLISALLGEMKKVNGKVNISGRVAYVPQQAWIQNATVKKNIIFTGSADRKRYEEVLERCALEPDLKILEAGDNTEIGEKGINLSGGQKQRISLARAVYANRDIYLLDDPLSAVDSHVGKHIFDQVIGPRGMLRNTTRIFVTHKVALLPHVDEIVVMKDGRISEHGSYLELLQRKGAFSEFLVEYLAQADDGDEELEEIKAMVQPELERRMSKLSKVSSENSGAWRTTSILSNSKNVQENGDLSKKPPGKVISGKLVEVEAAETGSVKLSVYLDYLRAIGTKTCIVILAGSVITRCLNAASSLWLTAWSDDAVYPDRANDTLLRYIRLGVYAGFGVSEAAVSYVSNLVTFYGALKASSVLHNMMLDHILRAPMSFFDTTPSGRILNRFGKDIDSLDSAIRMSILRFIGCITGTVATFSMISVQTPFFLVPLVPLGVLYYIVQRYYIMTARQLRRLESNSRSPVFSHFTETVSGTTCIRAFQVEDDFNLECDRKNDINNATSILSVASSRWLSIRLEFLGNLIVLLAALFAVFLKGDIEASTVGLSLSYALNATGTLNGLVTASADLENNLVSVERCVEYTKTPTEAAPEIEATKPKPSWPERGVIAFKDYSARYRDGLDLVLRDVNFSVNAGEKVGIVGRTGAGKSSLTVALFRIVEPASGTITIDGVDVSCIGLHSLRSGLTIIPQDPVLFTGTLRLNLDPFSNHDDSELWTALKLSHLENFVKSIDNGLEYDIAEGGDNLSVGQRQLVCLARALLRKSKILILDEATAAVDLETDDLIQKTIRDQFADCTILTIAHRLNTILDYDRVLVMDKGSVSEYDSPKSLLDDENSAFHSMAKDAGLISSGEAGSKPESD
ncbi:ATP-binding cassette sub-family C member 3 [Halotydeus destructor]|nr:ATP-binding cassette sub-family C member 3 [Halotydeus destructor]